MADRWLVQQVDLTHGELVIGRMGQLAVHKAHLGSHHQVEIPKAEPEVEST